MEENKEENKEEKKEEKKEEMKDKDMEKDLSIRLSNWFAYFKLAANVVSKILIRIIKSTDPKTIRASNEKAMKALIFSFIN